MDDNRILISAMATQRILLEPIRQCNAISNSLSLIMGRFIMAH